MLSPEEGGWEASLDREDLSSLWILNFIRETTPLLNSEYIPIYRVCYIAIANAIGTSLGIAEVGDLVPLFCRS